LYRHILLLHILGATVWTGGHLVLSCTVLPRALKNRSVEIIREFESGFEKIGIPALLIQVGTGLWLAYTRMPSLTDWLDTENPVSRLVLVKLALLLFTVILALHARLAILPILTVQALPRLAFHIITVTVFSVLFVWTGVAFRTGGFF